MDPSILILIIYSDNIPQYRIMHSIWNKYMNEFPEVKSYFLKCDPNINENLIETENMIITKNQENLTNITNKTIDSMDYLLNKFPSITHVIRTNISSFINIPKLIEFIKTVPSEKLYGGRHYYNQWQKDITKRFHFVQGSNIIFSRDVAEYLIGIIKGKKVRLDLIDDVLFGKILYDDFGILIVNTVCLENGIPENLDEIIKNNENLYHYRCKNKKNRHIDCKIQLELSKRFYPGLDYSDIKFDPRPPKNKPVEKPKTQTKKKTTKKSTKKTTTKATSKKLIHLNFQKASILHLNKKLTKKATKVISQNIRRPVLKSNNNLRIKIKK